MKVAGKAGGVGATSSVAGGRASGAARAVDSPVAGAVQGDAVSVSGDAHLMAVAQAGLARIPDVRTDKVEALKARIESDDYNPDGEAVAEGLLREHTPPAASDL